MSFPSNQNHYLKVFNSMNKLGIKYKGPLIVRMYGTLNKLGMKTENRYILCNFIDQYGDLIGLESNNIYIDNNRKSLNQLFLLAYKKAKDSELLNELYREYMTSINAICQKVEINKDELNLSQID
ncbi:MAG: hypothetical protein GF317_12535 [Candidatus Lokiarchaeota archaeon]|nr:hypothetical protein [Candidatus Lokiarchaeota archaeon]MBD3200474.1 hypothetical protein [Candidatus Lokiarchaeota archaeon]